MSKELIRLSGLCMAYEGKDVLKSIDLSIADKEFLTLLGPSGCGKTTTLRIIGGFETPRAGDVFFDGERINDVPAYKRNINTVFQKYALFPHLNVFENIAFGLRVQKLPEEEIRSRVREMLEIVSLPGFEKRKVHSLSGGQQQRIAIARALVNRPRVLLLDEPLGALDLKLRKEMQSELKTIQRNLGITFVYVTHDQEEALSMSDTVVVMHEGIILQKGTPQDIYNEPANAFVADFIGEANIINGRMPEDRMVNFEHRSFACLDGGFAPNEAVDVVIRPEDIDICPASDDLVCGTVESVTFKGVHYEIVVDCDGYKWYVHTTDFCPEGSYVGLRLGPDDIHIMPKMFKNTTNFLSCEATDETTLYFPALDCELECEGMCFEKGSRFTAELPTRALDITSEDIAHFTANLESMIYKGRYNEFIVAADSGDRLIFRSNADAQVGRRVGIRIDFAKVLLNPAEDMPDEN